MEENKKEIFLFKLSKEIKKTKLQIIKYSELCKPIAPENSIGRISRMDAINNKSVVDNYSIGEFEQDAIKHISNIHSRCNIAVLVGGSGLYLDVINYGLDQIPKTEKNIRNSLNNDFESKGLIYLQNKLKKVDLITYNNIDLNNSRTVSYTHLTLPTICSV